MITSLLENLDHSEFCGVNGEKPIICTCGLWEASAKVVALEAELDAMRVLVRELKDKIEDLEMDNEELANGGY